MRILIIPSFLFTKKRKTLASFVYEQAAALQRAGNDVCILYCDTYSVKELPEFLRYREETVSTVDGVRIIRDRCFCPGKHDSGFKGCREAFAERILRLYESYLAEETFDVIHAHFCAWAGYAAMHLSAQTGIPYVITEHATRFALRPGTIRGKEAAALREAFSNAKKTICVSPVLEQQIQSFTGNTTVIGNVIDCGLFRPGAGKPAGHPYTFLTVCHLETEAQLHKKGIDILLNAFRHLTAAHPHVRLQIGGGGSAVPLVKLWIARRGLQKTVALLGPLSRAETAGAMQRCDAFVLPSRYETFGVVCAEAMACGKPVIGTRTGGLDGFMQETGGLLVDAGDTEQLAGAMEQMLRFSGACDPEKIRRQIVQRFSMEEISAQLTAVYEAAAGRQTQNQDGLEADP